MSLPAFCRDFYEAATEAKLEYNQGVDFYKVGQFDRAMASFRRAIELDKNYIDAYYNLGIILEYLNQDDAALAVFKQIIVRKPEDYDSLYRAAELSIKLGQPEQAKGYLSLIPVNTQTYIQAQRLATGNLGSDMQTIKSQQAQKTAEESKFAQPQGVFENIASPTGVAADSMGNVYIASFSDNAIYKVTPEGTRVIFLKDARLNGPISLTRDNSGNIYVSNYNANNVLKVTPAGVVTVLLSNIQKPYGLSVSGNMLFISSQGSNSVVRYGLKP